jgi:hypothetical protein
MPPPRPLRTLELPAMFARIERVAIEVIAIFIVVSAVAGGIGLAGGGLQFPLEWLAGTPFGSYMVPAIILAVVVGGSSLAAAVLLLRGHPLAVPVALGAGLIQAGWIVGEGTLVGTHGDVMMWLQIIYFAAGAAIAGVAAHLWLRQPPRLLKGNEAL